MVDYVRQHADLSQIHPWYKLCKTQSVIVDWVLREGHENEYRLWAIGQSQSKWLSHLDGFTQDRGYVDYEKFLREAQLAFRKWRPEMEQLIQSAVSSGFIKIRQDPGKPAYVVAVSHRTLAHTAMNCLKHARDYSKASGLPTDKYIASFNIEMTMLYEDLVDISSNDNTRTYLFRSAIIGFTPNARTITELANRVGCNRRTVQKQLAKSEFKIVERAVFFNCNKIPVDASVRPADFAKHFYNTFDKHHGNSGRYKGRSMVINRPNPKTGLNELSCQVGNHYYSDKILKIVPVFRESAAWLRAQFADGERSSSLPDAYRLARPRQRFAGPRDVWGGITQQRMDHLRGMLLANLHNQQFYDDVLSATGASGLLPFALDSGTIATLSTNREGHPKKKPIQR